MRVILRGQPAYTVAYLMLEAGEEVYVERRAMVAMSGGIEVAASSGGGLMRSVARNLLGSEPVVFAKYTARIHGAWVGAAPRYPGDIAVIRLDGASAVRAETGSVLAYPPSLEVAAAYSGVSTLLMREGITTLRAAGEGDLIVSSYGAIDRVDLKPGEDLVVDSGHLVAFTEGTRLKVGPLGGMVTSGLVGEGLVCQFTGPGSVWIQTRSEVELVSWLFPERAQNTGRGV